MVGVHIMSLAIIEIRRETASRTTRGRAVQQGHCLIREVVVERVYHCIG